MFSTHSLAQGGGGGEGLRNDQVPNKQFDRLLNSYITWKSRKRHFPILSFVYLPCLIGM